MVLGVGDPVLFLGGIGSGIGEGAGVVAQAFPKEDRYSVKSEDHGNKEVRRPDGRIHFFGRGELQRRKKPAAEIKPAPEAGTKAGAVKDPKVEPELAKGSKPAPEAGAKAGAVKDPKAEREPAKESRPAAEAGAKAAAVKDPKVEREPANGSARNSSKPVRDKPKNEFEVGVPVRFEVRSGSGIGSGVGVVARSFPKEDRYTIKCDGNEKEEVRRPDGCIYYFRRKELELRSRPASEAGAKAPGVDDPKVEREAGQGSALNTSNQNAKPQMGNLKSVLNFMFSGPKRLEGRLLWFNKEKGYGRIAPNSTSISRYTPDRDEEVFVHKSEIEGGMDGHDYAVLAPGVLVTYELSPKTRPEEKPSAKNVRCEGVARLVATAAATAANAATTARERAKRQAARAAITRISRLFSDGLRTGAYEEVGTEKVMMEDRFVQRRGLEVDALGSSQRAVRCAFVAVFDGHAGASCSEFVSNQLDRSIFESLKDQKKRDASVEIALRSAVLAGFRVTEHNFRQYVNKLDGGSKQAWASSGTTATAAIIYGPDEHAKLQILIANLGDSRAVLGRRDGTAVRLSEDHKPDLASERHRIEQAGGTVTKVRGIARVLLRGSRGKVVAGLSSSRSFGDVAFKVPSEVVSPVPDVTARALDLDVDAFVIVATDGIWDNISDADAVRIVGRILREEATDPPAQAAEGLVKTAHERNGKDDKTAVVVSFGNSSMSAGPTESAGGLDASDPSGISVNASAASKRAGVGEEVSMFDEKASSECSQASDSSDDESHDGSKAAGLDPYGIGEGRASPSKRAEDEAASAELCNEPAASETAPRAPGASDGSSAKPDCAVLGPKGICDVAAEANEKSAGSEGAQAVDAEDVDLDSLFESYARDLGATETATAEVPALVNNTSVKKDASASGSSSSSGGRDAAKAAACDRAPLPPPPRLETEHEMWASIYESLREQGVGSDKFGRSVTPPGVVCSKPAVLFRAKEEDRASPPHKRKDVGPPRTEPSKHPKS